ncbi:MAG: tetratricopeptide repeat protein [Hormoscilla sp. SP5CHS1]|nr:tetratricopeptide repeat protein [Hormoscilla sp. SP12CHS1]MBC6453321.1 tetratricopeptide repeat protein [Hormoscilla sp. SP5CHS1]
MGISYHRWFELGETAKQYEQGIALKQNYLEAICNLGVMLQKQSNIAEAIAQDGQALAIKPDDPEVYNNMGTAWESQERKLTEAISCYKQAIALKPDLAEVYINLGIALQEKLKIQETMGYYRYAIALKPDAAMARFRLGELLLLL